MKKLYILIIAILISGFSYGQDLILTGVIDATLPGGSPKGVELYATANIPDLSLYGVGSANNGGGTDGSEVQLSGSASSGDYIYVAYEANAGDFNTWFGFSPDITHPSATNINGDDAIELFYDASGSFSGSETVIDVFGDINTDGTNQPWEYLDGWAYRVDGTGPDGSTFTLSNWIYSGKNVLDGETSNAGASTPFPNGTYSTTPNTDPTLKISGNDAPANGSSFTDDPETAAPGNATIDFETTNFTVGEPGTGTEADGYIVWSVVNINNAGNNDGGNIYTANDGVEYVVTGLIAGETYDFTSELVDNSGASLSPAVVYSFTIAIAQYNDVSNLAALRLQTVDPDIYYRVTEQVINTATDADTEQVMYFQDATGAIKVFDPNYEVQSYNTGDAVSNIRGHLEISNGTLQFVPTFADWGTPDTTGNTPSAPTVDIATITANLDDYESELVNINGVTFDPGDVGNNFVAAIGGTGNYDITDSSGTMIFRSDFGSADYIGTPIPGGSQNLTVIVSRFFGTAQVVARSLSDFTLGLESFEIEGFSIYPNPTSTGTVTITSTNSEVMNVQVFDVLGKQMINQRLTNNNLNVSNLKSGLYIVKIIQNNASITKKLVIK